MGGGHAHPLYRDDDSPVHRLPAEVKIVCLVMFVLAVVATPRYFAERPVPRIPTDLRAHSRIRVRLPNGELYHWQFEQAGQAEPIDVQGPITLDEASLARMAVLDHIGIGYFIESDVAEDLEAGRLVRMLEGWTPVLPDLALYYPDRRNASAASRAFIDLAREVYR